nr:DUF5916 domain-containing protein [Pseudohalioglobus lutimaris]
MDWFPYARASYDSVDGNTTYRTGMDVFWRPTNAQRLNIALNPDYGQVESDDLVVNFSAIEVFFEERRPFFIEGQDLFEVRGPETLRVIHTPRIGGEPDAGPDLGTDVEAAARYSYTGNNIDFGLLAALEDDARNSQGRDYLAGRARYRWQNLLAGVTHSRTERPQINRIADVSVFDFQYDLTDRLLVNGLWLYSNVSTPGPSDPSDSGWVLSSQWEVNPRWTHELTLFDYGDELELNDLGYVKRVNREQFEYETGWELPGVSLSRFAEDAEVSFEYQWKTNQQGDSLPREWATVFEATTAGNARWNVGYEYVSDGIDDLITEGQGNVWFPSTTTLVMAYEAAPTSIFRLGLEFEAGESGYSGQRTAFALLPSIQIGESLQFDLELAYELNDSWVIWTEDNGLGEYDLEELSLAANVYYSPSTRHEIRLKVESTAVNAKGIAGLEASHNSYPVFLADAIEDFSESAFAVQLRYRYELSALSEAFIVYSRGGEFESDESNPINKLLSEATNARDDETLLFKIKLHF